MGFFEKIKLLFKSSKPVGEFVVQIKGARLKYKTIPFWISLLGTMGSIVAAFKGVIPATTAAVITAVLTAGYNILRGADKTNQVGVKPAFASSEFWLGSLGIISTALLQIQTAGVQSKIITTLTALVAGAMAAAQNMGAHQPDEQKS